MEIDQNREFARIVLECCRDRWPIMFGKILEEAALTWANKPPESIFQISMIDLF